MECDIVYQKEYSNDEFKVLSKIQYNPNLKNLIDKCSHFSYYGKKNMNTLLIQILNI